MLHLLKNYSAYLELELIWNLFGIGVNVPPLTEPTLGYTPMYRRAITLSKIVESVAPWYGSIQSLLPRP